LKEAKRRYIVGTPKGMLKHFEPELRTKPSFRSPR
jgi:hypothetical protein